MNKIKSILKAFVVIALIPILVVGGSVCVSPVASVCLEKLSHPLFLFPSIIMMLPWGFLFFVIFFLGVGFQPTFVMTPMGQGGYMLSSGKGRGGGIILSIIKFIITIPLAILIWFVISLILLFSTKIQKRIDKAFVKFSKTFKSWYKIGVVFFVAFPIIVLGFNALENTIYSPSNIEIVVNDFSYESAEKVLNQADLQYYNKENYKLEYTIDPCGEEITEIRGTWVIVNKKTNEKIELIGDKLTPFDWQWENADKSTAHQFSTVCQFPEGQEFEFNDLEFICNISYISYDSNIPILGDFLFREIDNEYNNGFPIEAKGGNLTTDK